jgi:hypothetical protein
MTGGSVKLSRGAVLLAAWIAAGALAAQRPVSPGLAESAPAPEKASAGLTLAAQGRCAEALPLLQLEIARSPDDPRPSLASVRCLYNLARWNEALEAARPLLEKFPVDPEIRFTVGDLLLATFHAQEAVETWRPLLADPAEGERALQKVVGALAAQRKFGEVRTVLKEGQSRGIPVGDATLRVAADASGCPDNLALFESLASRHEETPSLQEALRVHRQICEKGGRLIALPSTYPDVIRASADGLALKVRLDGRREEWVQLDSGTDSLILDVKTGKKLALAELGQAKVEGIGSHESRLKSLALLPGLEAGNLRVANTLVLLSSLQSPGATARAGIVGLEPFLGCIAEWDRRKSRFTLWREGTAPQDILGADPDVILPVLWTRSVPFVPVSIDGKGPFPFLFDTGAAFSMVSAQFATALGLHVNSGKFEPGVGSGASGLFLSGYAEEVALSLGGQEEAFPWVRVAEVPQRFLLPVVGILGMDILSGYRVIFDGPGSRILLTRYTGGRYRDPALRKLNRSPTRVSIPQYVPPP